MIDDMREIEVVVAHSERVTLRVGDVFLKIDTDQARIDREVEVMARAPIPTPEVLWRKPPVLALAAVPGAALGVLQEPSRASSAAWVAAGAAVRTLHDAPLPPWPSSQCQQQPALSSRGTVEFPPKLDSECEWLVANDVVSADVVRRNRQVAEAALRPWTPVFIHGDLQIVHVFVDGDEVSGVVDWSEGGQGDAMYDLATLTLAHEEHLDDVVAGYGGDIEIDVIRAYWSLRSLMEIRWLVEHGYGAPATFPAGRGAQLLVSQFLDACGYHACPPTRPNGSLSRPERRLGSHRRSHAAFPVPSARPEHSTRSRRGRPDVRAPLLVKQRVACRVRSRCCGRAGTLRGRRSA